MSDEKVKPAKRTTNKAVAATESAPSKKAATPKPKSTSTKAVTAAVPAITATRKAGVSKSEGKLAANVVAPEQAKPKKAVATAKAKGAADQSAAAKSTEKKPTVRKAATAKAEAGNKASATQNLIEKPVAPSPEERQRWIATAAYHRAQKRGFAPGYEMQDWFDAEKEIEALVGKA